MDSTLLNDIKDKLRKIGARDEDIEVVLSDMGTVIVNKIMGSLLSQLTDEQSNQAKTMSPEDLFAHLKNPKNNLKFPTNDEIAKLCEDTWRTYLLEVGRT